jgi:predicted RND superfamily exporter protein
MMKGINHMSQWANKFNLWLLKALEKHHKMFLLLVLLSIPTSIYFVSKLEIRSGFEDLLPQNNKAVQILKKIPEKVGGAKYVKIAITTDNIAAAKRFAEDYVKALRNYSEIQFIKYKTGNKYFKEHFLQYLDTRDLEEIRDKVVARVDYEKRKNNPFYFALEEEEVPPLDFLDLEKKYQAVDEFKDESYYVTKDQKVLFILARPKGYASNIGYARKLLKEMKEISDKLNPTSYDPSLKVFWLGAHYANLVEYDALVSDVTSTSLLAFVLLFFLYYFYCRRFKVLFYILMPPIVAVAWTAASAYFLIGHINSQTAFLGAILLGLIDMSIHLTSRYYEERHAGQTIFESLRLTLTHTGYAVLVSSITLFVAFLSLIFSDFVGFWQFGLLAAAGVALSVMATCLIIPAMVFWLEKDGDKSSGFNTTRNLFMMYGNFVDRIRPSVVFQRGTLIVFIVIGLVCVATAPSFNSNTICAICVARHLPTKILPIVWKR